MFENYKIEVENFNGKYIIDGEINPVLMITGLKSHTEQKNIITARLEDDSRVIIYKNTGYGIKINTDKLWDYGVSVQVKRGLIVIKIIAKDEVDNRRNIEDRTSRYVVAYNGEIAPYIV